MPYNIILYFRLPYFHVSNCALFSTQYFSTLILYRRSLDTFYCKDRIEIWKHNKRFYRKQQPDSNKLKSNLNPIWMKTKNITIGLVHSLQENEKIENANKINATLNKRTTKKAQSNEMIMPGEYNANLQIERNYCKEPEPRLNIKTIFSRHGIPMLKIRQLRDRLFPNMEIPILGKTTSLY